LGGVDVSLEIVVKFESGESGEIPSWRDPSGKSGAPFYDLAAAHLWIDTLAHEGISGLHSFAEPEDDESPRWFDAREALPMVMSLIIHFSQEESGINLTPGGSRHTHCMVMREPLLLDLFALFSLLSAAAERGDRFHLLFLE
jgi:hypothetical protein